MIKEIFSESTGGLSAVRVNSFIALLAAIALSVFAIDKGQISESTPLIISWLVAGFAPKVVQKFAEKKNE